MLDSFHLNIRLTYIYIQLDMEILGYYLYWEEEFTHDEGRIVKEMEE